jgi:hypothetical protein
VEAVEIMVMVEEVEQVVFLQDKLLSPKALLVM